MFLHKVYRCFCSRPIIVLVLQVLCLCFFLISAPTFQFLALSAPQNLFNAIISVDGHLCSSNLSPLVLGILLFYNTTQHSTKLQPPSPLLVRRRRCQVEKGQFKNGLKKGQSTTDSAALEE
jgi:hypothetical protein